MIKPINHLDGRSRSRRGSYLLFLTRRIQKLALVLWSSAQIVAFVATDSAYATGGGLTTIIASQGGSGLLAYVQVQFGPPAGFDAGAAWRVQGTANWVSSPTTYTDALAEGATVIIECKPIPGWNLPTNNTV